MPRRYVPTLFAGLFLLGCAKTPSPMVGVWELKLEPDKGMVESQGTYASIEFKPDGTYSTLFPGPVRKMEGRYELDGRKLTMITTAYDGKPKDESPLTVELAEDLKSFSLPSFPGPKFVKR